jgi:hypothetical protein
MTELKKAVRDLLATLERVSPDRDAIKVSIVPFDTQVNLGEDNRDAAFLDFNADVARSLRVARRDWRGCITDRDMPYDTNDTGPVAGVLYPAVACGTGSLTQLRPLTSNFDDLRKTVGDMTPSGNTNITIGVAWGLASLSPTAPLDQAVAFGTPLVQKIMVVLTDGDNTQNRWSSTQSVIDARTDKVCTNAKTDNIKIYTIRVIDGNASLLQSCASKPEMYYEVAQASQLNSVFTAIAQNLANLRIAK